MVSRWGGGKKQDLSYDLQRALPPPPMEGTAFPLRYSEGSDFYELTVVEGVMIVKIYSNGTFLGQHECTPF